MRKALLLLILAFNFAHADYLNSSNNTCVKYYWYSNGKLYYQNSSDGVVSTTSSTNMENYFSDGFDYNATSRNCQKSIKNSTLNMSNDDYNFAMALTGLFCGVLLSSFALVSLRLSL